ncbi:MAG TPA: tripartite tricarboxylate transporter substrate-binding protein [Ramlibacter sp.]|nr:tripartite tricarboxylate transporter substrate-binding protein [Ramlibacter sp.]
MSKSTRLLTATYILSYVAASAPEVVTTERISSQVDEHPTRVRQIVADLVKAGLLVASRGAAGGVSLKKPASEITLHDIQQAVQDGSLLNLNLFEPSSEWAGKSRVHLVFENLRDELEKRIRDYLGEHTLDQTYAPIIVPFSPGGTTDMLARTLGEHLGGGLGAPVLVEHVPPATRGRRTAPSPLLQAHATRAQVDGRTLTIMTNSGVLAAALAKGGEGQDPGLLPVTLLAESEMILAVSASSPWVSVQNLARSAKSTRNRRLRYASVGRGSVSHLCGALFARATGAVLEHHPYGGAQPAVKALIDGEVDLYFGTPPTFLPHVRAGSVRALATTALHRAEAFPDLPRMADIYPGFEVVGWHGVFAPAGTAADVVQRLCERVAEVMALPEVRRRLARQGFRVAVSSPAELAQRMEREVALWRERLEGSGLDLDGDCWLKTAGRK